MTASLPLDPAPAPVTRTSRCVAPEPRSNPTAQKTVAATGSGAAAGNSGLVTSATSGSMPSRASSAARSCRRVKATTRSPASSQRAATRVPR